MTNIFKADLKTSQFVTILQTVLGILGIIYFVFTEQYYYFYFSCLMMFVTTYFSHNIALHKYFSHNSFQTNKFWHIVLSLIAPLHCAGSPISYAVSHRAHHAYSDSEKDPHSPTIGLFRVMFYRWNLKHIDTRFMKGLSDPWMRFSHNWYGLIILFFVLILAVIDLNLILSYSVSIVFSKIGGTMINYVCHLEHNKLNYRNFNTKDFSSNNLITGLIFGEWHNNHHENPKAWNQKVKWWELDISAYFIKAIKK
jgi:stearoyl-CoA desaturase (delta-9 desaturase)